MPEKAKRSRIPPPTNFNLWKQIIEQVRLSWKLFFDVRVSVALKVIPFVAVAYVLSPIDLLPDFLIGLGWLDDGSLLMLALVMFINLAPRDVVDEHLRTLRLGQPMRVRRDKEGMIIDVKAEPSEDESDLDMDEEADMPLDDEDAARWAAEEGNHRTGRRS
jgi:uncharacterized membrane protein YkvA (DUF1232 family)